MAVDKKYLEQAKEMLSGGYENQKVQLNNSFNQNVQSLDGQKAGINQNFDNQLQQNAMNTTRSVNQYNNNTIARGLGRSTIATSGQAGIRDQGNRIANQVNDQRTQALGNLEAQKTILQQNLQNSLLGLTQQRESDSMNLARDLERVAYERDWSQQQFEHEKNWNQQQFDYNKTWAEQQFEYQQSQDKWNQDFKMSQFEYQKQQDALARQLAASRSSGSGSSGSSGSGGGHYSESQMWSEFNKLMNEDLKNGSYEAGRFAQTLAKYNPRVTQEMMRIYNDARKKKGTQPKQSYTNNRTGTIYQNY